MSDPSPNTWMQLLHRLLQEGDTWPTIGECFQEIAASFQLPQVGVYWPEQDPACSYPELPKEGATFEYPFTFRNQPGVFWATGKVTEQQKDWLKLVAGAIPHVVCVQRLLETPAIHSVALDRLKSMARITGRIAHDIDNTFQAIYGHLYLLFENLDEKHPAYGDASDAFAATQRGINFTKRLHQFSQAARTTPSPCTPQAIMLKLVEDYQQSHPNVQIHTDLPNSMPVVMMDQSHIRLVVGDLLLNALEANGVSEVKLGVELTELSPTEVDYWNGDVKPGTYLQVTVADNGLGIMQEIYPNLLKELINSSKLGHHGLGLLIIALVMRMHRGGIRIHTTPNGTTIRVLLPMYRQNVANNYVKQRKGEQTT